MALREQGRSFAAIARTLGLKRAGDAREAFLRELRSHPDEERHELVERELERLDQLEARIRSRDADEPDKLQTRLSALAAMRQSLR
jgi:DNA-binding transcriptional MerR regulator